MDVIAAVILIWVIASIFRALFRRGSQESGADMTSSSGPGGRPLIPVHGAGGRRAAPKPPAARPAPSPGRSSSSGSTRSNSTNRPWDRDGGSFSVRRLKETFTFENGREVPVSRAMISGSLEVPRAGQRVAYIVNLIDITDGEDDEARPVFCAIDDLSDENGIFESIQESSVPYRSASFQDLPAGPIPDFALHAARKGQRRFRLMVRIVDADDHDRMFAFAWSSYSHTQREVGYEEWGAHQIQLEKHVAEIGLAASIADGTFDSEEFAVISKFFSARFRARDDREELRTTVSDHMKATVRALKDRSQTTGRLIRSAAAALREDDGARTAAFELAVRVVAADDQIKKAEDQILTTISTALELDDETVRSVRERVLRIEMFEDAGDEMILGMPPGLSLPEKLAWLTTEYNRWRSRVHHNDPKIVAEANSRLDRISRLRTELQRQS